MDSDTYIELDARQCYGPYNYTVATFQFRDETPDNILESIARRLKGRTVSQLKNLTGFSWWDGDVSDDTVVDMAYVVRV